MSKEIRIALIALLAIVILWLGINFLKGRTLAKGIIYYAQFDNVNGLTTSNPIMANGYRVGTVRTVNYDYTHPGHIVVGFSIDKNLPIPNGSTAEIESDLMGNLKMNLLLANDESKLMQPGDTLMGFLYQGKLEQAATLIPVLQQILPKVDSIAHQLNIIMADPAITASLHNVQQITTDLTTSTKELNTLLATTNKNMPQLMQKAQGVMTNAEQVSQQLSQLDLNATMKELDQAIADIHAITQKLNQKEGSMGQLINDPALYNKLNETLQSANALLEDIRQHPKRYVSVSVFGKKEK